MIGQDSGGWKGDSETVDIGRPPKTTTAGTLADS